MKVEVYGVNIFFKLNFVKYLLIFRKDNFELGMRVLVWDVRYIMINFLWVDKDVLRNELKKFSKNRF